MIALKTFISTKMLFTVWSAKHSRTRELSSVNVATLNATIESNSVLHNELYQIVDQSPESCFHYPEVQGQRVILPGQCDLTIPVVLNFDVAAVSIININCYP